MGPFVLRISTLIALAAALAPENAHAFGRINPIRWITHRISPPPKPNPPAQIAQPPRIPSDLRGPAIAIEQELWDHHMHPSVIDPVFASADPADTRVEAYVHAGDSAIWTGHYLAAASYRYAVESDPAELDRIRALLDAIETLIDVTPGRDQLTRYAIPADDPMAALDGPILFNERANGIYRGTHDGRDYYFLGRASRDQYAGVFLGLSVAYEVVQDDGVRARCRDLVTRMLDYLNRNDWRWDIDNSLALVQPKRDTTITFHTQPLHKAGMVAVGRQVNPGAFTRQFSENRPGWLSDFVLELETLNDYKSYFKYNLDYIHYFNLIRLEFVDSWRHAFFNRYGPLRSTVLGVESGFNKNALFNLYDLVISGAAPWSPCGGHGALCPAHDGSREAATARMLEEWNTRPRRATTIDRSSEVETCKPPFSWLPFGLGGTDDRIACKPIPVPLRPTTDFLWQRSPQQLRSWGDGRTEFAGIDLLLPYWMARYYSVLAQ